jgi:hypothetical protein
LFCCVEFIIPGECYKAVQQVGCGSAQAVGRYQIVS